MSALSPFSLSFYKQVFTPPPGGCVRRVKELIAKVCKAVLGFFHRLFCCFSTKKGERAFSVNALSSSSKPQGDLLASKPLETPPVNPKTSPQVAKKKPVEKAEVLPKVGDTKEAKIQFAKALYAGLELLSRLKEETLNPSDAASLMNAGIKKWKKGGSLIKEAEEMLENIHLYASATLVQFFEKGKLKAPNYPTLKYSGAMKKAEYRQNFGVALELVHAFTQVQDNKHGGFFLLAGKKTAPHLFVSFKTEGSSLFWLFDPMGVEERGPDLHFFKKSKEVIEFINQNLKITPSEETFYSFKFFKI